MSWWLWPLIALGLLYHVVLLWGAATREGTPLFVYELWDCVRCVRGRWFLVRADGYGTLWESRWPFDDHRTVEVVDATPQTDGSRRRYRIRVPPNVSTAREAVAWTFGFEHPAEYTPSVET